MENRPRRARKGEDNVTCSWVHLKGIDLGATNQLICKWLQDGPALASLQGLPM